MRSRPTIWNNYANAVTPPPFDQQWENTFALPLWPLLWHASYTDNLYVTAGYPTKVQTRSRALTESAVKSGIT